MSNELLVLKNLEVVPFFTKGDSVDETLAKIEAEALAFVAGDLSVKKNRDAIKAMVTKVTKSKTYLESSGKELAVEYKAIPKAIDATRKKTKDFLTELQAKVRLPLTEWETEQARIEAEKAEVARLAEIADKVAFMWEFAWLENEAFDKAKEDARLYQIEQQRIRDEAIAAAATKAAEDKAKADIEAAKQLAIKAEQDAINAESKRIADAKQAEQDAIDQAIKVKADAEAAEALRIAGIEQAKQDAINAENKRVADVKAAEDKGRQRQVDAKAAEDKAIADRKARTNYVTGIKTSQKQALIELGASEELAISIVKAMHAEKLPNIKVIY